METQASIHVKPFRASVMTAHVGSVGLLCTGLYGHRYQPDTKSGSFRFEQLSKGVGRVTFPSGRSVVFTDSRCGMSYAKFRHHDKCEGVFHEIEIKKKDLFAVVRYTTTKSGFMSRPELREQVTVIENGRHFVNAVSEFEKNCRKNDLEVN